MSQDFLERFLPLLAERTGLHVREKDRPSLARTLGLRLQESALTPDDYLRELERDQSLSGEWKTLVPRLTNGESYFLRDKGQISLLRDRILPELLERRKGERSLRVWSAGCSTGEEAYTLAMLVSELLPQRGDWNVCVLGTDINEVALEKARQGVYGTWAFRSVPDEVRARHFVQSADGLQIRPELRQMVKFAALNLRGHTYPNRTGGLFDMDLILCRNVLIYFDRSAVLHALSGFTATLRTGGYLLTGHAELAGLNPAPLAVRTYAQSVAYQKQGLSSLHAGVTKPGGEEPASALVNGHSTRTAAPSVNAAPPATVRSALPPQTAPDSARPAPAPAPGALMTPASAIGATSRSTSVRSTSVRSTSVRAPAQATPAASATPATPAGPTTPTGASSAVTELCSAARVAANAGRYAEAEELCRRAAAADAVNVEAYTVWAHVAEESGNTAEAKNLWKKIIYLAPSHPEAYVELGGLYARDGDDRRARQMRETALTLLRATNAHEGSRAPRDVAQVEALTRHLEQLLVTDIRKSVVTRRRA